MIIKLKQNPAGILLNGEHKTVRAILHDGDTLELATEDEGGDINENLVPSPIPVDILYEDGDIIALNKPPFMPTHPTLNHYNDTLANGLCYYYAQKGVPFVFRALTRLDSDTSGLVLIAKNKASAYKLSKRLIDGEMTKSYIAIVRGEPVPREGVIKTYIRRVSDSVIAREVCGEGEGGAYAETFYQTLGSGGGYSVLRVMPKTGRTHQIRVHMAYINCPVASDFLYGTEQELGLNRQALHMLTLDFQHPSDSRTMRLTAPPPDDIMRVIGNIIDVKTLIG